MKIKSLYLAMITFLLFNPSAQASVCPAPETIQVTEEESGYIYWVPSGFMDLGKELVWEGKMGHKETNFEFNGVDVHENYPECTYVPAKNQEHSGTMSSVLHLKITGLPVKLLDKNQWIKSVTMICSSDDRKKCAFLPKL